MKYERLTIKRENGFSTVRNTTLRGLIDRLAELEDKIARGELIDRNEYLDRPVREILNRMFQIIGRSQDKPEYRNRLTSDMLDAIDEFAEKYGVDVEE